MKITFTLIFLSLLNSMIYAQQFAPIGAKWYYEVFNSGINQNQQFVQQWKVNMYECVGEEMINGFV